MLEDLSVRVNVLDQEGENNRINHELMLQNMKKQNGEQSRRFVACDHKILIIEEYLQSFACQKENTTMISCIKEIVKRYTNNKHDNTK